MNSFLRKKIPSYQTKDEDEDMRIVLVSERKTYTTGFFGEFLNPKGAFLSHLSRF